MKYNARLDLVLPSHGNASDARRFLISQFLDEPSSFPDLLAHLKDVLLPRNGRELLSHICQLNPLFVTLRDRLQL